MYMLELTVVIIVNLVLNRVYVAITSWIAYHWMHVQYSLSCRHECTTAIQCAVTVKCSPVCFMYTFFAMSLHLGYLHTLILFNTIYIANLPAKKQPSHVGLQK